MPPVRTAASRASRACISCRARKTRCYDSPGSSRTCLRCSTLRLSCSLTNGATNATVQQNESSIRKPCEHKCEAVERRVELLEQTVERLSRSLEINSDQDPPEGHPLAQTEDAAAPLMMIRDAANSPEQSMDRNVPSSAIDKGLLTSRETKFLLDLFRRHCGRWIGMDETNDQPLKTSSYLLSCACCLVAARHSSSDLPATISTGLFAEARKALSENVLSPSEDLEFFQAILVLSLWSTTIGQEPLSMDSWLITSIAFQHDIATRTSSEHPLSGTRDSHDRLAERSSVWSHLCLSHLHACISTHRQSMITRSDIDKLQTAVTPSNSMNFETRMVAELLLYWTIDQECIARDVNLPRGQAALQAWKADWAFLFEQPRHHFLQMSFWFAQLLMYEKSLRNKSAAVRESLVSQMLQLCSDTLRLAMKTADDRMPYLTDHIYHMITFASVTLCRLLSKYDYQLDLDDGIQEMDNLVIATADWLQVIGSGSHIGKIMSEIIRSMHRRLRPEKHSSPFLETHQQQTFEYTLAAPELFTLETLDVDWDEILQDWPTDSNNIETLTAN